MTFRVEFDLRLDSDNSQSRIHHESDSEDISESNSPTMEKAPPTPA